MGQDDQLINGKPLIAADVGDAAAQLFGVDGPEALAARRYADICATEGANSPRTTAARSAMFGHLDTEDMADLDDMLNDISDAMAAETKRLNAETRRTRARTRTTKRPLFRK